MAKIWPCYEGDVATLGAPWKELTLKQCEETLDLLPSDYLYDLGQTPHFGTGTGLGTFGGYQHVVVEVSVAEATGYGRGWKPGIYYVRMAPADMHQKLGLASTSAGGNP